MGSSLHFAAPLAPRVRLPPILPVRAPAGPRFFLWQPARYRFSMVARYFGFSQRFKSTSVSMPGMVPALVYCQMEKSNGAVGADTPYSASHSG